MTSKTTTKVRTYSEDNKYLNLLSLKTSADRETITTTAEVLHAIIEEFRESRNQDIDKVVKALSNRLNNAM